MTIDFLVPSRADMPQTGEWRRGQDLQRMLDAKSAALARRLTLLRPRDESRNVVASSGDPIAQVPASSATPQRQEIAIAAAPDSVAETPSAAAHRLRIAPALTERHAFAFGAKAAPAPHMLRMLVSTVLSTAVRQPICIVVPSAAGMAETVAIIAALECLSCDLPEMRAEFRSWLTPGTHVRLYPSGEVFEIASTELDGSLRLRMTDKETYTSNGTRYASERMASRFEPTTRRMPQGTKLTKFSDTPPNGLDAVLGSQIFANSALVRSRILLAGTRSEFSRTLEGLEIISPERPDALPLARVFHWGAIGEDGEPFVVRPVGSAGRPMVAIEPDLIDLERACLAPAVEPGSQIVLTSRLDMVTRDLDLAARIAERQRLVVFADARRRPDVAALVDRGWIAWEPDAYEISGVAQAAPPAIGSRGIDVSIRSASLEIQRSPGFLSCRAPLLARAEAALARLGNLLSDESIEDDLETIDLLRAAESLFFRAVGRLVGPQGNDRRDEQEALERLDAASVRITALLGSGAGASVTAVANAIGDFAAQTAAGAVTAKGHEVLRLAKVANGGQTGQIFVTGDRRDQAEAERLLRRNGIFVNCLTVGDFCKSHHRGGVVAFSVMKRDLFERLFDPWPAAGPLLVGYDFEIACYQRRLARRTAQRRSLQLSIAERSDLTGMMPSAFPEPSAQPGGQPRLGDFGRLVDFDRAVGDWKWTGTVKVPIPRAGEEVCEARIVKFKGRSWCAMTAEHEVMLLDQEQSAATALRDASVTDLAVGDRIVVREGGGSSVVRLIAEGRKGKAAYADLRNAASLWRTAILAGGDDPARVLKALQAIGVRRSPQTIRMWLRRTTMIGPRDREDVDAISTAFPMEHVQPSQWSRCWEAIRELRALHVWAGGRLTDILAARCGAMLMDPAETELAVDLGLGTVWVLEVASIDEAVTASPASWANRLHWQDSVWKEQLLADPIRAERS